MSTRSKTWWGKEFLRALENCMDPGRLSRGKSYVLPYRRKSFSIKNGKITATVVGNINHHFPCLRGLPTTRSKLGFNG